MNIGIIVHSLTGNTNSVALRLREKLSAGGHSVELVRLGVVGGYKPGNKDVQFETLPNIERYDGIVFGAPVEGFSLSPVMRSYLACIGSLHSKKVACFVTQAFPYPWMGGNQAIGQMHKICESKGIKLCDSGIVNWKSSRREQKIIDVVDRLSKLF